MLRTHSYRQAIRGGTIGILLLTLIQGTWASAQTYTLKIRVSPGERWAFDVNTSIKQKGQVTANGQPAQQIDQTIASRRKGTVEILAAAEGKPTAMRVTFDPESANTGTVNGQPLPAFALAGKTVTLRRAESGSITNDLPQQPDEQALAELDRMMEPDTSVYPDHPVAVNDEWSADTAAMARQFQLGGDDKVEMKCKLLAIKDLDGRQLADVSLAGQIVKHEQGSIITTTTLNGVTRIDLQTGQVLAGDIAGKTSTRGTNNENGPNGQTAIAVTADGTIEIHQIVKPLAPGQVTGAAVAANEQPPMKPGPAARETPLASQAGSTFAGSFKGDELSLDLSPGEADRYTGTMALKDKRFPVTAHAEGNRLTGTFQANGGTFDFTATLDGDTLKLTSGGSDYTMRRAAENPLGKPAPKNPLAQ